MAIEALSDGSLPSPYWSPNNFQFEIIHENTPLTYEEYKAQTQRPMSERILSETKGNITVSIVDNILKVKQYSTKIREDIAATWSKRYLNIPPIRLAIGLNIVGIGVLLRRSCFYLSCATGSFSTIATVVTAAACLFSALYLIYGEIQAIHWKMDFAERFAIERANCFNHSLPYLKQMVMVSNTLNSIYKISANSFISINEANTITKEFLLRPENRERLQRENPELLNYLLKNL